MEIVTILSLVKGFLMDLECKKLKRNKALFLHQVILDINKDSIN